MIRSFLRYWLLAPLAAVILIAACSKVTPENYAKVSAGMSREEVYSVLGKPDEVSGGGIGKMVVSSETWKGPRNTIHITFGGESVALKTISDNEANKR
jgi:hypothetical protein